MLDKDIDRLFKERFDNFEAPPSEKIWNAIDRDLSETSPVTRSYSLLLKVAAGILVFIAAGFWFYRPIEVIKLQGQVNNKIDQEIHPESTKQPVTSKNVSFKPVMVPPGSNTVANKKVIKLKSSKSSNVSEQEEIDRIRLLTEEVPATRDVYISHVLTEDVHTSTAMSAVSGPVVAKLDFAEAQLVESEPSKIKINSIGSLVNFMIAKVDHREHKIIEFKDTDEGSIVSGLNFGVLKFKTKD